MKKIKSKILISTIAALSTATIATSLAASAVSSNVITSSNNSATGSNLNVAQMVTITYNKPANVTLHGVSKAEIRKGRVFGSAQKPTATHSAGYTFLGWSINGTDILSNTYKVTSDITVTPLFSVQSSISGGSTTLQFKSDASGSDTSSWVLKTSGGTVTGATWTITDKTTTQAISGLTISNGTVSWNNVAAGNYTAVVKGEKDGVSATAEIQVISTDHTYTLSGGSTLLTAKAGVGGADANAWVLKDETSTTLSPTWTVTKADGSAAPTGVTIPSGKVTWTTATPSGQYDLLVKATYNTKDITTKVSLVIADSVYTLSGGSTVFNVKSTDTKTDTNTWTLTKDGSSVTTPDLAIESITPTLTSGTITISSGVVTLTNIPQGTYTFDVAAYDTVGTTRTKVASKTCSVVSTDHTYALSGGSTLLTANSGVGGSDTNSWVLYQDGTTTVTPTSWEITLADDTAAPTGVTVPNGKVTWTTATPSGKYDLKVKATYNSTVYTTKVSLVIADSVYSLSGGSTLFNVNPTETKTDTNTWTLTKDGSTVSTPDMVIQNVSPALTSGSITLSNYAVKLTTIPKGTYTFEVAAYDTVGGTYKQVAGKNCTVVSTETTYKIQYGDGTKATCLTVQDSATTIDTNGFKLYKDDSTTEESNVTWSIDSISPSTYSGTIAFDATSTNQLKVTTLDAGTYTMNIQATLSGSVVKSIPFTIVSKDSKITLEIAGKDTLNFESGSLTSTYTVNTTRTVTWSVESWTGATAAKPTIDQNGVVTMKNVSDPSGTLEIKANDATSGQNAIKTITVTKPEVDSSKVWTYDSTNNWSIVDTSSACGTSAISITPVGGSATTVARTSFNQQVVIGENVTAIGDGFLNGCTAFNSTITFPTDSACLIIGSEFLMGATTFNQTLSLPSTIQLISSHFLDGCSAFNNGSASFTLPTALTTIGSDFMNECSTFNQALTIASTVTYVGDSFLTNCNAMTSTLTINVADPSLVFYVESTISYTCATDSSSALCYTTGITVAGTGATEFKSIFENRTTKPYRNLK